MFTFPFNCFYKLNGLTLLYLSQNLILLNLNGFTITITNYSLHISDIEVIMITTVKKIEKNHNAQVLRKHFFLATVPHSRLKFILHCNTTSLFILTSLHTNKNLLQFPISPAVSVQCQQCFDDMHAYITYWF